MESIKREKFQVDIVLVGCGIASLSTAVRLFQRINVHNKKIESGELHEEKLDTPVVLIIEKSARVGNHVLSGAVMNPVSLRELFPDFIKMDIPLEGEVKSDSFYYLKKRLAIRLPFVPPIMRSKGSYLVSLSKLTQWFAEQAETMGVEIFTGFAAIELLKEENRVTGVRLGDKGIGKDGKPRTNILYGDEILSKLVVLGEGVHGTLTQKIDKDFNLFKDALPQSHVLGIKEIVKLPEDRSLAGTSIHTFGFPHNVKTYGGGFIYGRPDNQVAIGLATALNYSNPKLDTHALFLKWKSHPFIKKILSGGEVVEYGAKTIPEGGFFSIPKMIAEGLLIVGDNAGLLNSLKLKGIHLAIQSGIEAGDVIFSCWKSNSFSLDNLEKYQKELFTRQVGKELYRVRNIHQCFQYGRFAGIGGIALNTITFGKLPAGKLKIRPDCDTLKSIRHRRAEKTIVPVESSPLLLDKLSDVYLSGTKHEEDQPSHIRILDSQICVEECVPKFDHPCTRFCPAQVYEWFDDEMRIQVNFTNCLHCKTCEIKDPFKNIEWTLPEGGGGPRYKSM